MTEHGAGNGRRRGRRKTTMEVEVRLSEAVLARRFAAALRRGRLPEMFFYWSPLSVAAWLRLCGKGRYRNYRRSLGLVRRAAAAASASLPRGPVDVVSVGAGQGDKDLLLLKALRRSGRPPAYHPVDASQGLLEAALAAASAAGFACRGVKADFGAGRLPRRFAAGPPRLVLLLGNTLGCAPRALAAAAARLLRPGDRLLVDGELIGPGTLDGYDNPVNRRFAFAPLAAAGIAPEDGELRFRLVPEGGGLFSVRKYFLARRLLRLRVGAAEVRLPRRLEMSPSYKYTPAAFRRILAGAGLRILRSWRGERFRLALVSASKPARR